jgi:enoyl-CoA hydratase
MIQDVMPGQNLPEDVTATPPAEAAFASGAEAEPPAGLRVEIRGPVGWLIFDRPHAGNAMDGPMLAALPQCWRRLELDPTVRAIVVTGTGSHFNTGLDMKALARQPASLRATTRQTRTADLEITGWHLGVSKPTIAAVNGTCAGGGLHFVVDADIVIAAPTARFMEPHVSVGQASAWESIGLTRRIAATVASRLALVGRHEYLGAERARQIGLVSEILEPGLLVPRAQWLGERLAEQDPKRIAALRAALWQTRELGLTASYLAAGCHRVEPDMTGHRQTSNAPTFGNGDPALQV